MLTLACNHLLHFSNELAVPAGRCTASFVVLEAGRQQECQNAAMGKGQDSGSDSEGFAPDEDFVEADQEASKESGDEGPTEEYDTEEEAPEEVRHSNGAQLGQGEPSSHPNFVLRLPPLFCRP